MKPLSLRFITWRNTAKLSTSQHKKKLRSINTIFPCQWHDETTFPSIREVGKFASSDYSRNSGDSSIAFHSKSVSGDRNIQTETITAQQHQRFDNSSATKCHRQMTQSDSKRLFSQLIHFSICALKKLESLPLHVVTYLSC